MKLKLLGGTGLRVSELCLGAMTFGNHHGWGASGEDSKRLLDAFRHAGGTFLDTANVYQEGESERLIGELLADCRREMVVGTKYGLGARGEAFYLGGSGRKSMVHAVEDSLRRLKTDYIDLYILHAWDGLTGAEEVMRGLDDLVRAGKILYIGFSDVPAWTTARAYTIAEIRGWSRLASVQVQYNLLSRSVEAEILPMAIALGLTVTPWAGLASGMLSGKYGLAHPSETREGRLGKPPFAGRTFDPRNFEVVDCVARIAAECGRTSSQVALAWLRSRSERIVPIIGARTVDQLKDNLGCLEVVLTDDQLTRLEAVSRVPLAFPASFLTSESIRETMFGASRDRHAARFMTSPVDGPYRGGAA